MFLPILHISFFNTIFGHIHQYQKVAPIYHFVYRKCRGGESWDLCSNQKMGLEVQKDLDLLMLSEVNGRRIYGGCTTPFYDPFFDF